MKYIDGENCSKGEIKILAILYISQSELITVLLKYFGSRCVVDVYNIDDNLLDRYSKYLVRLCICKPYLQCYFTV